MVMRTLVLFVIIVGGDAVFFRGSAQQCTEKGEQCTSKIEPDECCDPFSCLLDVPSGYYLCQGSDPAGKCSNIDPNGKYDCSGYDYDDCSKDGSCKWVNEVELA